ncbi:DUF7546 family protein [Halorussus amylolyticus]|uniref:DUF7546 family protein n=1 Tax=Halorussus amylolyticus TaxID=1126242 RepID=UPI00104E85D1|nr:hypothetical protein [Halorussus amylolyticus]
MTATDRFAGVTNLQTNKETLLRWGVVLNFELLLILGYFALASSGVIGTTPESLATLVYPFVWINVGAWAVLGTTPASASRTQVRVAGAIAGSYLLVLLVAGGVFGPGHVTHGHTHSTGLRFAVTSLPPGWGPALLYGGAYLNVVLMPYKLIGYAALAYLVYATVLDASGTPISGLLGLLSCVSCTFPVLAAIATGVAGGTSGLATAVYSQSYALSTVVFVLTVGLLYWRPFSRSS